MKHQRWLRIIPVALVMYTISYVDRTNISLALEPRISSMMRDLAMDDKMKGQAMGIFFLGYVMLQVLGGRLATRWSAKKLISILLLAWGLAAVGCALSRTFHQFALMRFLLGVAESGVFPATLVLLANWFPSSERARANAFWNLCQPLAVIISGPITGQLLSACGWRQMIIFEGVLPFLWLPMWWFCINDHPREAKWISPEERTFLETTLQRETVQLEPQPVASIWEGLQFPLIFVMISIYFLHSVAAYGCMTFFTSALAGQIAPDNKANSGLLYGVLFAIPYAVTAVIMVLTSWHSDKTRERRGHLAAVYTMSGTSLIASVLCREHFWPSYVLLCFAIPGPFAALAPFWAMAAETLPRRVLGVAIGLVNALGSLGGYVGPSVAGWLKQEYNSIAIPFSAIGAALLVAAALAFCLPPHPERRRTANLKDALLASGHR
jgi:MFS family permease